MPINIVSLFFIMFSAAVASADNSMTLYSDGSVVVKDATAIKGMIEAPLAAGLLDGTLKVEPANGTTLLNVEMLSAHLDKRSEKELESLTEQSQRLQDRLRALDTREEIFKSAAKSQSGKAPRKTKSNPDPMQAIRQGTDYAIAQLETVYTTRRKTEQEIKKIDARIALVRKNARPGGSYARITVTPANGRVTIRYATSERGWLPHYNMYIAGDGFARLQFSARIVGNFGGHLLRISPGNLTESGTAPTFPVTSKGVAELADYRFPLSEESFGGGIYNNFSGRLTNTSTQHLPSGEAVLYKSGVYLGKFRFEGFSSGRSRIVSMGSGS